VIYSFRSKMTVTLSLSARVKIISGLFFTKRLQVFLRFINLY